MKPQQPVLSSKFAERDAGANSCLCCWEEI